MSCRLRVAERLSGFQVISTRPGPLLPIESKQLKYNGESAFDRGPDRRRSGPVLAQKCIWRGNRAADDRG
jgi:hypothetical protein